MQGTVKKWIADRGFGFIIPDNGTADIFAHVSNCDNRALSAGQRVQYDVATGQRTQRPEAVNVVTTDKIIKT